MADAKYHNRSLVSRPGVDLDSNPWDSKLRCPVCGYEYNHVQEAYCELGCDPWESGGIDGVKTKFVTQERRDALVILIRCEQGHIWRLKLQQHKGHELLTSEYNPSLNTEDQVENRWWNDSYDSHRGEFLNVIRGQVLRAITNAKSPLNAHQIYDQVRASSQDLVECVNDLIKDGEVVNQYIDGISFYRLPSTAERMAREAKEHAKREKEREDQEKTDAVIRAMLNKRDA